MGEHHDFDAIDLAMRFPPMLSNVDYDLRQAKLSNGTVVNMLVLYGHGLTFATLWQPGSWTELGQKLMDLDALTKADVNWPDVPPEHAR